MSSSHLEGPLLRRSIPFVERWIAELAAARAPPVAAKTEVAREQAPRGVDAKGKKKGGNAAGAPATAAAAAAASGEEASGSSMSKCRFVVGKVVDVRPHPESEKLYIEEIDLGEAAGGRRTILSGLQGHVSQAEFVNRLVLVIANLEPRKIGGIVSEGMVLCASQTDGDTRDVKLLDVPADTPIGERVVFEGHDGPFEPVLKKKLAKHFEKVAADLKTNEKGEVVWGSVPFRTSRGVITAPIRNGVVS
ncbi:tyrosyl or methionyl-tRNA synthetase [Trypanosoma conorhini]|uniref:Tyrosyl or methionyl-tRNA synthetase n=1 Tax=Trypanosoma conorhini TaxID=83891 RepID=A0A3R7KCK6_9TRYP|nr:tyrosyl or methionyl-tRNA synthetase [Trypanosoma conorhini]RNF05384.1 tyrosyl or methionyl-tRNA synthetase [Trypanosoma conorhini]